MYKRREFEGPFGSLMEYPFGDFTYPPRLIDKANARISIFAIDPHITFWYSFPECVDALRRARRRGVEIRMVAGRLMPFDSFGNKERPELLELVKEGTVALYVRNPRFNQGEYLEDERDYMVIDDKIIAIAERPNLEQHTTEWYADEDPQMNYLVADFESYIKGDRAKLYDPSQDMQILFPAAGIGYITAHANRSYEQLSEGELKILKKRYLDMISRTARALRLRTD